MTGTLLGIVFGLLAGMLHDRFARTRWLWLCLVVVPVSAQVESRTEEIEAVRRAKAQHLESDDSPRVEQAPENRFAAFTAMV